MDLLWTHLKCWYKLVTRGVFYLELLVGCPEGAAVEGM